MVYIEMDSIWEQEKMETRHELEAKIKELEDKLEKLNKAYLEDEDLLNDIPVLRGEAAEQFVEYNNRPRTEEEIAYMKKAEECYLLCDAEEREKRKHARIARGILTNRYDDLILTRCKKGLLPKIKDEDILFIIGLMKDTIIKDVMKNLNVLHEAET